MNYTDRLIISFLVTFDIIMMFAAMIIVVVKKLHSC
jgi:hypothetical protein